MLFIVSHNGCVMLLYLVAETATCKQKMTRFT